MGQGLDRARELLMLAQWRGAAELDETDFASDAGLPEEYALGALGKSPDAAKDTRAAADTTAPPYKILGC